MSGGIARINGADWKDVPAHFYKADKPLILHESFYTWWHHIYNLRLCKPLWDKLICGRKLRLSVCRLRKQEAQKRKRTYSWCLKYKGFINIQEP